MDRTRQEYSSGSPRPNYGTDEDRTIKLLRNSESCFLLSKINRGTKEKVGMIDSGLLRPSSKQSV